VMATSVTDGDRMAWEAQLSPITDDDIDVCWVSSRDRVPWLWLSPARPSGR
jgi:hypothetical protein